jgi:Flp pilus assembly pilin Flp
MILTWMLGEASHHREERGASVVEYALLVGLIAVVCAAAIGLLGQEAAPPFSSADAGFASN